MEKHKSILVCLDGSESSQRLVAYVADIVGENKGWRVRLFHVLAPMPPELLEFGGSENAREEQRQDEAQKSARAQWQRQAEQKAEAVFLVAKAILGKGKVPSGSVETKIFCCSGPENIAEDIIREARNRGCGTIVVGRHSFSWLDRIFSQHVADRLIREGEGLAVWVVE